MDGIYKQYPRIFGNHDDKDENGGDQLTPFQREYPWLIMVDRIAGGNKLKWDDVFELPARQFLNFNIFQIMQNEQMEYEIGKHKTMV